MKCKNRENGRECGVELPPGANFCGECGADVRTVKCPKCSEIVKETQKFCHGCKWKVDLNAFDSESVNLIEKKEEEIPDEKARIPDVPQEPQLDDQGENNKCTKNKVTLETTEKLPGIQEQPGLSGNNERAGSDDTRGVLEGSSVDGDSKHNTVTKNDELTNVPKDNEREIVKQIKSPVDSSGSETDSSSSSEDSAETDDNGDDTDNTHLKTEINENSTDNISQNESGDGGEDHKKTSCHESEDHSNGSDTEGESDGTEHSSEELSDEGDVTSLNDDSNKSIPECLEEDEEKRDETATRTETRINKTDMKNVEETASASSNSTDNQNRSKKSALSKIKAKLFKKSSDSKKKRKKKSEKKTRSKIKKYGTGDGNASQPAVSPSSEMSSRDASNKVAEKLEDQLDANKSEGAGNVNQDKVGQSTNNDPLNNGQYKEGQEGVSLPSDTQNGKPGTEENLTQNNTTSQEKPDDQKNDPLTQQSLDTKSKTGTSNTIPGSKTKGQLRCIDLYFHAILSPTILSSKSDDTVFVKINGITKDTLLKPKRDLGDGFVEYEGMVSIQKNSFRPHEVVYNYFVKIKNEHVLEEFVYNHNQKGFNNRSIKIQCWETTDVYHQYDGVVRSKPVQEKEKDKGILSKFVNFVVTTWKGSQDYENILREDAGKAIGTFLPQWEASLEEGLNGEAHIAQIQCVLNSLMENYFRREKLWPSFLDFENSATEFLRPHLEIGIKIILDDQTRLLNTNKKVIRLTTAATIVYLKEHYKVKLEDHVLSKLCEALLPNAESDQKSCPDLEEMNKSFPKLRTKLSDYMLNMVKSMLVKGIDHSWLKCIPVFHYLQNKSQPFQVVPGDVNHNDPHPKWWGIETFKNELETFKSKYKSERSPDQVFQCLLPYSAIDFFLPRTFVASMTLQQLTKLKEDTSIPADTILAAVYYYVKGSDINTADANEFQKIFSTVSCVLRKAADDRLLSAKDAKRTYKIALQIVQLVFETKQVKLPIRTKFYISVSEPYVLSVCWFFKCMEVEGKLDADKSFEQKDKYKWCKQELCKELTLAEKDAYLNTELWIRLWDQAMKIIIPKGTIKDDYVKYLQKSMEACLSKKQTEESLQPIIDVYCNLVEEFAPELQEVLSSCAFRAVETCANYISKSMHDCSSEKRLKHYGSLLSHVFDRNLDASNLNDKASYVHHALSWAQFPVFVKMFMTEGYAKYLQPMCAKYMKHFTDVLKTVSRELIDATITLENLECIINEKQHYISIVTEMKEFEKESVEEIVNIRDKEFKTFIKALSTVKEFIYTCKKIKGDTDDLEERLKICQDTKQAKLETVCNALKPTEITSANVLLKKFTFKGFKGLSQYNPCLIAFGLDEDILKQLPQIVEYSVSDSFNQVWTKIGNELNKKKGCKITITEVVKDVWEPAKQFWADLCQKLKDGDLLFSEFDDYFDTSDLEKLKHELIQFNKGDTNISWIKMRLDQISNYKNVFICLKGANAINEIAKKYQLNGDFSHISNIINMTSGGDTPMKTFDDSLVKTCSILKGIDDKKVECLNVFSRCKDLITWLRKSMKTGLKELKVFVELANMSAGETDIEVDRVQFLHAATTGYAPLIFNLDSNCSDIVFLQKCEIVWKELEADPKLPKKLKDTCQHLEWFKSVKKSHGSIEVNSLSQTEAINAFGTYEVGNSKGKLIHKPELKSILDLSVIYEEASTEQEDSKGPRIVQYKYEQLLDLQSRLMLIAGKAEKGKEEVDRFMLILDSVVRLGNIYIKLVTDGCVLFNYWHSAFLCDKSRPACTFVNFGQGEDMLTLKCRIDESTEDVSAIIPKLAKILEKCHKDWLDYINEKRKQYPLLNLFNIDQIVILQKELVRIGTDKEPSALIYPILSAVKKDCTRHNLTTAMSKAKAEISSSEISEGLEVDVEKYDVDEEKEKLLDELTKNDFSVLLAREALKHCDNIEDAIDWCYDHEGSFVDQDENESKETMFTGWTQTGQSMATFTASLVTQLNFKKHSSFRKLKKALEKLWKTFLNSVSSSVSDYLSVEHLGIILNKLFEQETFQVCRTMPSYFKLGEPNLVICPQSEMYNTVLSLYIDENESSLPQSDEVLLCTVNTSIDMVEIFWRRALYPGSKKLYCIVNIDLLDYEVSDKAERTLQRLMKDAEYNQAKYRLIVLCSTENENKSVIVRSLAKYHRNQVPVNVFKIQEYLASKLKMDEAQTNLPSASAVDFDKSSVRVVQSWRAGVGKTLYKKRMVCELNKLFPKKVNQPSNNLSIPLHEKVLKTDDVMSVLLDMTLSPGSQEPRIFHFDISHEVEEGVDFFLFQLLILGCLTDSSGYVWRKSVMDYYIIESMPLLSKETDAKSKRFKCLHHCLDVLPHVMCRSPQESLDIINHTRTPPDYACQDLLFDSIEFQSATFQRPYQYLKRLDTNKELHQVDPSKPEGTLADCLLTLLRHCGIKDPSWSELHHFVSFLDKQLQAFEVSSFCSSAVLEDLPGFPKFVLKFLIQMSRDFSTRSLKISEESPIEMFRRHLEEADEEEDVSDDLVQLYQMRRTWETSPHPYLFFNPDGHSMTFLGFNIDKITGNLIDRQTNKILERGIMQKQLWEALGRNHVDLAENFDALSRDKKIKKLCNVMGIETAHDPDQTYELTTDNVKKMLAIYMRFRCDIPVIIMGETGCGKTRLVKFMCELQTPPRSNIKNMILMKVHGGTKPSDIINKVEEAEKIAEENTNLIKNYPGYTHMDTVLFFDEANTTEAIGIIKEIMCDKSLKGRPIELHKRLKIVAACNPYRKHSDELIKKLEQAGLGYHVDADRTSDRLGRVPMRRLVYRVQPLPQSMLPLVWDFGQLNIDVEEMYIRQMVLRYINEHRIPSTRGLDTTISKILTMSQDFMRKQKDECSFVSLRDVERVLDVMSWFYSKSAENDILFSRRYVSKDVTDYRPLTNIATRSLVMALGVCYHACLKKRSEYRTTIAKFFTAPLELPGGAAQFEEEITRCQSAFLDHIELAPNIAKNQALRENVFMMIVCIELRIPMFLVGKPGSSKSLAKTIVADAMQGNTDNELFKHYKQAHMVSFQCSPLSTPDGIVSTFSQCAAYQKDKELNRFVSVVVLDEVGLAEDSPKMPLKTLHPLLEDGCTGDEKPERYKKVAFIGISNWALDPAKMNRGILVQREVPDIEELINSANGICSSDKQVQSILEPMISPMAVSYLELFTEASVEMREFFGLRDFYSLIKMLYGFILKSKEKPTMYQLTHSILRNFGGLEMINPVIIFLKNLASQVNENEPRKDTDPICTPEGMIKACLRGDSQSLSESRYLLLLTENYGALTILQQELFTMRNAVVIFGSSFPSDQEYTQVCRNINRIKVCMETGSTVILLNLENLYESLYDALNQYYVEFGSERYVDLGLGTHRVKCRVHKKFRLIVVAEKNIVYSKFPIPLINRLEKHFLSMKTMLTSQQMKLSEILHEWAKSFCVDKFSIGYRKVMREIGDAFVGFHADTCPAIIQNICHGNSCDEYGLFPNEDEIIRQAKSVLLWCASPAAVLQNRDQEELGIYFKEQQHESLADFLQFKMASPVSEPVFMQVTTYSRILSPVEIDEMSNFLSVEKQSIYLLTLQSFHTEQQFSRQIKSCFSKKGISDSFLIVQCESGDQNAELIACARHSVQREIQEINQNLKKLRIYVIFLVQLTGITGNHFTGFQCGLWQSVHIDDLRMSSVIPPLMDMYGKSAGMVISTASTDQMEIRTESDANGSIEIGATTKQLDINHIILDSVQSALSALKDTEEDFTRTTERLKIVLNLLGKTNTKSVDGTLLTGIARHVVQLVMEKENTVGKTSDWLSTEVSRAENINKAGSFRKSIVMYFESRIIPILAGIFAFIDTNRNLNSLTENEGDNWQTFLWMQIVNNPSITQLNYDSIVSPTRQLELQEVTVKPTSITGKVFSASVPFSWLIFRDIEKILSTLSSKTLENPFCVTMEASEIFKPLKLGSILNSIEGRDDIQFFFKCYVEDFVHMAYPFQSDEEHKLICESVAVGCKNLLQGEFGRLLPSLFACHVVFDIFSTRFKNFSNIVSVWPGCCKKLLEVQHNSRLFATDEITMDILALKLLMDELKPSRDDLCNTDPVPRTRWLRRVCEYRPVIERIFENFKQLDDQKDHQYKEICDGTVRATRCEWTRILVVKLFIENVCTSGIGTEVLESMKLWSKLGDKADLKQLASLDIVEAHLKKQNAEVLKQCFGVLSRCLGCEADIQSTPVKLPCSHIICRKCYYQIVDKMRQCVACKAKLGDTFNMDDFFNRDDLLKYDNFRSRCNSFFMEVVSHLCFAEGNLPSQDVIDKLLSYIIGRNNDERGKMIVSKELTVFQDAIDPTPVVRSFLLQQLMQTSDIDIKVHLKGYFNDTRELLGISDGQHGTLELCLLILQCMEDSVQQLNQKAKNTLQEIAQTTKLLRDAKEFTSPGIFVLDRIEMISKAKYALSVVAYYIQKIYGTAQTSMQLNTELRHLFEVAGHLCTHSGSFWPKCYFVKELCRNYGTDIYQKVMEKCQMEHLQWVNMSLKIDTCTDRYILSGDEYTGIKKAISNVVLTNDCTKLTEILQKPRTETWKTQINLLLALYREIGMKDLHEDTSKHIMHRGQDIVQEQVKASGLLDDQVGITSEVLQNKLWKMYPNMNFHRGMDIRMQNIACLLAHFHVLMSLIPGKTTILTPLRKIAYEPHCMKKAYFPTMPEDEIAYLKQAMEDFVREHNLKTSWGNTQADKPTFYECPNGHAYSIADCGNPFFVNTCFCGAQIGGKSHVLLPGNKQLSSEDTTATGHILGKATSQITDISIARNKINRPTFAIIRLMTHLSMFVAANTNVQAVFESITAEPAIQVTDVHSFLLDHIFLDIESLHKIFGKGKDDIFMMMHCILFEMMKMHTTSTIVENISPDIIELKSKTARAEWEEKFGMRYISPVLLKLDHVVKKCNDIISTDKEMASSPMHMLLYEKDNQTTENVLEQFHNTPQVWRYRSKISVDHLTQTLNTGQQDFPVLHLFLREERYLRVVRFLPSILRLQKIMIQTYSRKLDRAEGTTLTIENIKDQMRKERRIEEFKYLLDDYIEAWDAIRQSLESYSCLTNEGRVRVNRDFCKKQIDDKTSVSYIIPTMKDAGLCSYLLLRFLLEKQNVFLDEFCGKKQVLYSSLPRVHVKDISSAHLISYHPDRDLLPMVLANCNYSFEVGQGTRVEYNFANLERQLMDRFLFSKSVINGIHEVEMFTYRAEFTNAIVLKALYQRIPQKRIPQAVKNQICNELCLVSFPDLCESLDKLDVAVSFLKSVGSERPERLLNDFMTETLKMEKTFPSLKAQQSVTCSHVMSWWMNIALERAKCLTKYNQEVFDGMSDSFKVPLTDEQKSLLKEILDILPLEQAINMVELVFEFITLMIDIPQNKEDQDYIDISDKSIYVYLKEYMDAMPYKDDSLADPTLTSFIGKIDPSSGKQETVEKVYFTDQNKLTCGQSIDFWRFINGTLVSKQQQRI